MKKWMIFPAAVFLAVILLPFFGKEKKISPDGEGTPSPTKAAGEKTGPGLDGLQKLNNVWILTSDATSITFFTDGKEQTLKTRGQLLEPVSGCIADLTVEGGRIVRLLVKEDQLMAKVLAVDAEGLELSGYGRLSFTKEKRMYRLYDGIAEETAERLLLGGAENMFVLEEGKVCAVLLREKPDLTTIRVLIGTNGFAGVYHETVEITSDTAFKMQCGETEQFFEAGEICRLRPADFEKENKRRYFTSCTPDGRLTISQLKRSQGTPSYRGTLEVFWREEGMVLINELPIEEYLYAVLPSEMPTEFPIEALKTQAICARSYAVTALTSARYAAFGAHVDDSVASQVYNNISECENSIRAVKETHGQVLASSGEVVPAYYFSTSCGYGAAVEDVWKSGKKTEYLPGILHKQREKSGEAGKTEADVTGALPDSEYPTEEEFTAFIRTAPSDTLDTESPWYRWQMFLSFEELEESLLPVLKLRYKEVPDQLLMYDEEKQCFVSGTPEPPGEILGIYIRERGSGGIVTELWIYGSKRSYLVKNEYNIRSVLAPMGATIYRKNASDVSGKTLLPSAFFTLTRGTYQDADGYLVTGGGNGHGVGMSQYGAKKMAELGYHCEEIIREYYPGATLRFCYD